MLLLLTKELETDYYLWFSTLFYANPLLLGSLRWDEIGGSFLIPYVAASSFLPVDWMRSTWKYITYPSIESYKQVLQA